MRISVAKRGRERRGQDQSSRNGLKNWLPLAVATLAVLPAGNAFCDNPPDPVLNLLLEKGMITESEAAKVQAQVDSYHTNAISELPPSPWKISKAIKDVELLGDVRLRFEDRSERGPSGGRIDLQRYRYAYRFGLRGDVFDDFYYGFRLESSSNPRSSMVTFGTSSPQTYGKSEGGIYIGQVYLGARPEPWADLTIGKMPNPLYTSSLVWSPSISPEGAAEQFDYTVGEANFFATFAQFLYNDENPSLAAPGLGINNGNGQSSDNIFQIAYQAGLNYQIATNMSAKIGATIYTYFGQKRSTGSLAISPYYGDPYVGEGGYTGNSGSVNGYSGYPNGGTLVGDLSANYPNNQVGINNLLVLEVPFEFNFKISKLDAKVFGDFGYNFEGNQRAEAAAAGYAAFLANAYSAQPGPLKPFAAQRNEDAAYQIGLAVGSEGALGMVNGTTAKKNGWEARTYWQHIEQYSLDPNLLDLDFFAGAENLQGIYAAFAYGFTDNFIGTVRYGYASRINGTLGTGGSGTDIPQINPISVYQLFQFDLTFKF